MKKFWQDNKKAIKFVVLIFVFWQIFLCLLNFIAPFTGISYRGGYNYVELKPFNPPFLWNWANYDGIHYLDISRKGYGIYQQAFFPLYPKLIRILTPLFGGKDLLAGIFISNFSLFILLFLFYKLIILDYKEDVAKRTLIFLLLFPTSFFLGMVYTESLFLLLVIGSFYSIRRHNWLLGGILGALASYTRLVGIFLFPVLLYEWWQQIKIKNLLPILLTPIGLLAYMRFLWKTYGDPLMFVHVQPFFGGQRSGKKIILIYQVFWRYLKMILTTKLDILYLIVWLELFVALGILVVLFFAYLRKMRLSYLIFAFFAYIAPTFSGTFSSMPRYALVLFPFFIYIGLIEKKLLTKLITVIFGIFFVVLTILFFRGYWVA